MPSDSLSSHEPAKTSQPKRRMAGRDIHETHRVSTSLELLFDLTFVVAIAAAAAQLHHAAAEHHLGAGLLGFVTTFFAIWWAWMSFTWFASAYDTDDVRYRFLTMTQMVGVLVLAAGVPQAAKGNFSTITVGYIIMRVGLIALWLRAAAEHPERRTTCLRYAFGIGGAQVLWVARLWLPASMGLSSFVVLALLELAIPMWAARAGHTPWHAHHIAERFGLFTIIVLGECVLGASNAIAGLIEASGWSLEVILVGFGSASLILSLWWVYFLVPSGEALHKHRERAFRWGYGHAFLFMSLAALGAFLGVVADQLESVNATSAVHSLSPTYAVTLVASAVGVYLVLVWWMNSHVARQEARLKLVWLGSLAILAAVVFAVSGGLPLAWAIPALTLAPALVVGFVERDSAAARALCYSVVDHPNRSDSRPSRSCTFASSSLASSCSDRFNALNSRSTLRAVVPHPMSPTLTCADASMSRASSSISRSSAASALAIATSVMSAARNASTRALSGNVSGAETLTV